MEDTIDVISMLFIFIYLWDFLSLFIYLNYIYIYPVAGFYFPPDWQWHPNLTRKRPGWWKFSQLSPGEGRAAGSGWNITLCFGWSVETFSSDTRLRTPDHRHHHHCWPSAKVDLCHLWPGLSAFQLCNKLVRSETTAIQGFKKSGKHSSGWLMLHWTLSREEGREGKRLK